MIVFKIAFVIGMLWGFFGPAVRALQSKFREEPTPEKPRSEQRLYEAKPKKELPPQEKPMSETPRSPIEEKLTAHSTDNGIAIDIDLSSLARFNVKAENISVEFDTENDEYLDFMFDVYPISGSRISEDMSIVISLYIGARRVDSSEELLYAEDFYRRDTVHCTFFRDRISQATRIEMYAKKY